GVEKDGVQAHSARARRPLRTGAVAAQAGKLLPVFAAIGGAEEGRILDAGIDGVGLSERGLEVPHPFELPWMLGAVVPLVRGEGRSRGVVLEAVGQRRGRAGRRHCLVRQSRLMPRLASIAGALNQLPKPSAGLRDVN